MTTCNSVMEDVLVMKFWEHKIIM